MARKTLNRKNMKSKNKRSRSKRSRSVKNRSIRGGGMYDVGSPCSPNSTVQNKNVAFPKFSRQVKCCNGKWVPYNGLNAGC
jgi:hypothetical protein